MRSPEDVALIRRLADDGRNNCEIARLTGIPRTTVRDIRSPRPRRSMDSRGAAHSCRRCGAPAHDPGQLPRRDYVYLLGLYLGDGYIAANRRDVYRLQITLDLRYPGIIDDCAAAMRAVHGRTPGRNPSVGCVHVNTYSKQWPCLFPQHGSGRKHERPIVLADWQRVLVAEDPRPLLRGLIHSDGCRSMNTVKGRDKAYSYPRYTFSNASDDIRGIFCDACDALGIEWRRMNARNISVARRASVARLDEFMGPKR